VSGANYYIFLVCPTNKLEIAYCAVSELRTLAKVLFNPLENCSETEICEVDAQKEIAAMETDRKIQKSCELLTMVNGMSFTRRFIAHESLTSESALRAFENHIFQMKNVRSLSELGKNIPFCLTRLVRNRQNPGM
jgi:hypothetical protein